MSWAKPGKPKSSWSTIVTVCIVVEIYVLPTVETGRMIFTFWPTKLDD